VVNLSEKIRKHFSSTIAHICACILPPGLYIARSSLGGKVVYHFWASGSGSLDVIRPVSWVFLLVDMKENVCRLFVRGWFVHDGGKELKTVSAVL